MQDCGFYTIISGALLLLTALAVWFYLRYRAAIREKNRGIFSRMQEQTRMAKELEHTLTEKKTLEKILQTMLKEKYGNN
jgi:hypothetical protein